MNNKHRGFTLIELLVVILIISIVTTVAITGLNRHESTRVEAFAKMTKERLLAAREEAMLQPSVIRFALSPSHSDFLLYQPAAKNKWAVIRDGLLKPENGESDFYLRLEQDDKHPAEVTFGSNGDVTPFILLVGKSNAAPLYKIVGEADGSLTLEKLTS